MKRRKLTEQQCDKVVQKYNVGIGYGRISRLMRIPRSTVRAVIQKWKGCRGSAHQQESGHTRTASVSEPAIQSEEQLDGDQKTRLGRREQRIVPSRSRCGERRLEHLSKRGRVHGAKRVHRCEIAGTVIAFRGKKG